jgi:hypothetical protein
MFLYMLNLIDKALPNKEIFNLPDTVEAWNRCADEWSSVMLHSNKAADLMKGTVLAGDGLVVPITAVSNRDRTGGDIAMWRNRKGCFALIVQVQYYSTIHIILHYF